ncbi:type III secretion system effector BopA family protein [Alcaligenes sp. Marseille-Q7550]
MFKLTEFSKIAKSGHEIELGDYQQGSPALKVASVGFKGKVLGFLSHVPLLKDLGAVKNYVESVRVRNGQVLGVFIQALAVRFGNVAAKQAVCENGIDLSGRTPLTSRSISKLIGDASRIKQSNGLHNAVITSGESYGLSQNVNFSIPKFPAHNAAVNTGSSSKPAHKAAANANSSSGAAHNAVANGGQPSVTAANASVSASQSSETAGDTAASTRSTNSAPGSIPVSVTTASDWAASKVTNPSPVSEPANSPAAKLDPFQHVRGFANLGNTCYANSALKFLMFSIGIPKLSEHLQGVINRSDDEGKKTCAEKFMNVINASIENNPNSKKTFIVGYVKEELADFFEELQKQPAFGNMDGSGEIGFKIVGEQQDARDFLARITDLFELNGKDFSPINLESKWKYYDLEREASDNPVPAYYKVVTINDASTSLQGIIDKTYAAEPGVAVRWNSDDTENVQATKINRWIVDEIEKLDRFNLNIEAVQEGPIDSPAKKLNLQSIDFNSKVKMPVLDKSTNQTWVVSLEPRDVVIHAGNTTGGHYYMYSKLSKGWSKHNDSMVSLEAHIPPREQPKLISFAVVEKQLLE